MGQVPIGMKLRRRIERETGESIVWASGNGGYWFAFTTTDHRHGWWHKRDGEVNWSDTEHMTSCRRLFPDAPHTDA